MWHNSRRGHNLIRKRYSTRKFRLNLVNICIIIACVFIVSFAAMGIYSLSKNINTNQSADKITGNNIIETNASANIQIYKEEEVSGKKEFNIAFLGELMMGGTIGERLNYNYMSAFKNVSEYTSSADYTVVNLATNIIDLKELKDTKSKYIVTKNIMNAFNALGIDGINIANDHMLDFGGQIFKDTKSLLKEDYDLIGLKDTIVYVDHDGIKVAVIGICNEVIGTEGAYTEAGIMMYNMKKIKSMIKSAKEKVNTIIVLTHLGLENSHTITNIMSWFYRELVDAGADAVLGSHAMGLYPVEIYNGKPIIYSMSNIMSDTDYLLGKEGGIFTLNIDEKGEIQYLEILPTYINAKKQTLIYSDYNKESNTKLLKYLTNKLNENIYTINDNKVKIKLV